MQFDKSPEFGRQFNFPENIQITYNGSEWNIVSEIAVKMAERYESKVIEQIAMEAKAAGVASVTVLNKTAILDAIQKRTPKKPIRDSLADRSCPICCAYIPYDALNDDISDAPNFCKNCGQALNWRSDNA